MWQLLHALPQSVFHGLLGLLLWLWRLSGLAPLVHCSQMNGFRTNRLVTASAVIKWLGLVLIAPILFQLNNALYDATNVAHSMLFQRIAELTMLADLSVSLALLGSHIWQRRRLQVLLNGLARLQNQRLDISCLRWPHVLLLCGKLLLSMYELLCNVPFFRRIAPQLAWPQLLAYGTQLYVQHVSSIYGNGILALLLLLLAHLELLEREWCEDAGQLEQQQVQCLLRRKQKLRQLCESFVQCFQFGIFLTLIANFLNILGNMYTMLDYFVGEHGVPLTMSNYCLIVTLELYALLLAAHWCQTRHACLQRQCLENIYVPINITEEQAMIATQLYIWPVNELKFSILGLFDLDNAFWLFLVSYAANFIVIILQFTMEHMKRY